MAAKRLCIEPYKKYAADSIEAFLSLFEWIAIGEGLPKTDYIDKLALFLLVNLSRHYLT